MTYVQRTICPYDCPTSCGLLAETDGKKILRVKGDKTHPANKGLICGKMQHYEESINSEKRILTPLRRTGKKGSGQFMPITWEEAGNEIAERFLNICREDGPPGYPSRCLFWSHGPDPEKVRGSIFLTV